MIVKELNWKILPNGNRYIYIFAFYLNEIPIFKFVLI